MKVFSLQSVVSAALVSTVFAAPLEPPNSMSISKRGETWGEPPKHCTAETAPACIFWYNEVSRDVMADLNDLKIIDQDFRRQIPHLKYIQQTNLVKEMKAYSQNLAMLSKSLGAVPQTYAEAWKYPRVHKAETSTEEMLAETQKITENIYDYHVQIDYMLHRNDFGNEIGYEKLPSTAFLHGSNGRWERFEKRIENQYRVFEYIRISSGRHAGVSQWPLNIND